MSCLDAVVASINVMENQCYVACELMLNIWDMLILQTILEKLYRVYSKGIITPTSQELR